MAVSKTTWQFGQRSKWRLIAVSAEGASFPSKYQQIKWIVSLQVIAYIPQNQIFELRPGFISAIGEPELIRMFKFCKVLKNRTLVAVNGLRAAFVSILQEKLYMPPSRCRKPFWDLGQEMSGAKKYCLQCRRSSQDLAVGEDGHLPQRRDAVGQRWMCAEERRKATAAE